LQAQEVLDATKHRQGKTEALALAHAADRIIAMKGKKVVAFDMKKNPPSDEVLLEHLLGPTGNLRAPTLRKGKTLLIGFSEEGYASALEK
jgi:arsenate reductase-like glutaredoxin family protein